MLKNFELKYLEMDFEGTMIRRFKDESTAASSSLKIVKLADGSIHKLPVVNSFALKALHEERNQQHHEVWTTVQEENTVVYT